ncbi:MAG: hypothetical protein II816_00320 [Elusimicrobia bacterium]|nr:hypothetical protein [Elusimicrobiota bacterium]
MKFLKFLFIIAVIFLVSSDGFAKKAPILPNAYDGCGVSARSLAMGRTGVAMPGSYEGIFYNPATLGFNEDGSVQIEAFVFALRNTALDDVECLPYNNIKRGFNSFVIAQNRGAISWRTLSSYNYSEKNGSDYFNMQESVHAVTVSMANVNDNGLSVGLNLSYLYGTILYSGVASGTPIAEAYSGNGFTMDIGLMYPLSNGLFFGANFENVVGFMWWDSYGHDQMPFGIRSGIGYALGSFTFLADYNKKFYRFGNLEDQFVSVGMEQYFSRYFAVRVGAQSPSKVHKEKIKYTYGAGINLSHFSLSVACENFKTNEENIVQYYTSLKIAF